MGNLGDVKGKPDVTRERREDGGRRGGWGEDEGWGGGAEGKGVFPALGARGSIAA